jgi:hypothetical protein
MGSASCTGALSKTVDITLSCSVWLFVSYQSVMHQDHAFVQRIVGNSGCFLNLTVTKYICTNQTRFCGERFSGVAVDNMVKITSEPIYKKHNLLHDDDDKQTVANLNFELI